MYRNALVANGRNEIIRVSLENAWITRKYFFFFFFLLVKLDNGNITLWNNFMKFRTWLFLDKEYII